MCVTRYYVISYISYHLVKGTMPQSHVTHPPSTTPSFHPTLPLPLWNLCPQFPLFLDSSVLIYKPLTFSCLLGVQKPVILWVLSDIIILYSSFILSPITHTISIRNLFAIFSQSFRNLFAIFSQSFRNLKLI